MYMKLTPGFRNACADNMTIQRDLNGEVVNWMVHLIQVSKVHTDRPQKSL